MTTTIETRLYTAIKEKDLRKVKELINQGADCNLSHFDSNSLNFVSPIELAAKNGGYRYRTLLLLYEHRHNPTKTQLEKHLAFYYNHHQLSKEEENEILLVCTVSRLLHSHITSHPKKEFHIIIAALYDFDDAKLRGRKLSVGSTYDKFLQLRIFTLFRWIVKMKTDYSLTLDNETLAVVESELLHNLETYYFLYDITQIPVRITKTMDDETFEKIALLQPELIKFYRRIAKHLISKIEQLRPKQEYTVPTGWKEHAVCVSFRRISQTHISIRIDNPSANNPPKEHKIEKSTTGFLRIKPKVLGQLHVNDLVSNEPYFILLVDSVKRDLLPEHGIALIYNVKKQIQGLDRKRKEDVPSFIEQAGANCFVKCFEPGLRIRLGDTRQDLCERLLLNEKDSANRLLKHCEEKKYQCSVNGSYNRFALLTKGGNADRLAFEANAPLQSKLQMSYQQRYQHLSSFMTVGSSNPMMEKFVPLKFSTTDHALIKLKDLLTQPRVLVLGEAGCGKTTLCQYAAYSWACGKLWQNQFEWLFYIALRNLNLEFYPPRRNNYALIDIIERECFQGCTLIDLDKLKLVYQFEHPANTLWILDGCDERYISDDERTIPHYLHSIEQELFAKQHLLLTSRSHGTNDIQYDVRVRIEGFTNEDIKQYIEQYFTLFRTTASECWSFLRYSDQLRQTARIPACLELICILWDSCKCSLDIGITIGHLYEKMCEYLLLRYLLKFHGKCRSALAGGDIYQHPDAMAFSHLEKLAFEATKLRTLTISRDHIENLTGKKEFISLRQIGLLIPKEEDLSRVSTEKVYYFIHRSFQEYLCARFMIRALMSTCSNDQKTVIKFITDEKYNIQLQNTFRLFFELKRTSLCMDNFWKAVDSEPRDLVGLRHCSRIIQWFPYGSCIFTFEDEQNINKRTLDPILAWISNTNRLPHDYSNTYLFEWFESVIDGPYWLRAWEKDLIIKDSLKRRYFLPDLWSTTNVGVFREIYPTIPKNVHVLHRLIKNGPTTGDLRCLNINSDLFTIHAVDERIETPEFLIDAQKKAERHDEMITSLEDFRDLLLNYSSYAELNRRQVTLGKETWRLKIAPSTLINIDNETIALLLQLSQQSTLFFRDFDLPVIAFLELYSKRNDLNDDTLCSLIVSIAFSSNCIITAPPEHQWTIRVHNQEKLVNIELDQRRWLQLLLAFDQARDIYGYSSFLAHDN